MKRINFLFLMGLIIASAILFASRGAAISPNSTLVGLPAFVTEIESNKRIARRLFSEIVAGGKLALIDELISSDAIDRTQKVPGREGFRQHITWFRNAFPDVEVTIDDLIAEGDKVVVYWTAQGTHKGEFWGVQPTGRKVTARAISILTIKNGQVVEYNVRPDGLNILLQLGSLGRFTEQMNKAAKHP